MTDLLDRNYLLNEIDSIDLRTHSVQSLQTFLRSRVANAPGVDRNRQKTVKPVQAEFKQLTDDEMTWRIQKVLSAFLGTSDGYHDWNIVDILDTITEPFSINNVTSARGALSDHGYIRKMNERKSTGRGGTGMLWSLTEAGRQDARDRGLTPYRL